MLSEQEVLAKANELVRTRGSEATKLDVIHAYWRGKQGYPLAPSGIPDEVRNLAGRSRVNLMGLVVDVIAQSMYVDGYRRPRDGEDAEPWAIWQANRMDARQAGFIRSALAYGTSYGIALPGDPVPVMRGVSPRRLTAVYGDDPDWPRFALESDGPGPTPWRVYDETSVYYIEGKVAPSSVAKVERHDLGFCPIVRFRNVEDLDDESPGEIEPLMALQDQLDITTFGLLVAQHFQSFRQRYIIGWTSDSETEKAKASASRLWTFDDDAKDIKIGEFDQVDLSGYLESRDSIVKHLGIISQTPPHSLLGEMANLAAEALAAAEAGQRRKIAERETSFGEAFEQFLGLAGSIDGIKVDPEAQVRWRDTEARSLAQVVDALGKMAKLLGVPPQELWERVPGVSQQDVERWRAEAKKADAIGGLTAILDRQMGAVEPRTDLGLDG